MSVYLRGQTWWLEFTAGGQRHRESAKTKDQAEAKALLKKRLAEATLGLWKEPSRLTVSDAIDALLADWRTREIRSQDTGTFHLEQAKEALGIIPLGKLTENDIAGYADKLAAMKYSPATRSLKLGLLKSALKLAVRRRILDRCPEFPAIDTTASIRQGFLEVDDFDRIAPHLEGACRDAAEFAYQVGWRYGEVVGLQWSSVFLREGEIRLSGTATKNKRPRIIPIDPVLYEILERRQQARLLTSPYVFHESGRSLKHNLDQAWRRARVQAGLPDALFHDMRRSAVRNMIRANIPQAVVMQVSGHRSAAIFSRYNIVSLEDLKEAGRRRIAYLAERRGHNRDTAAGASRAN